MFYVPVYRTHDIMSFNSIVGHKAERVYFENCIREIEKMNTFVCVLLEKILTLMQEL